MRRTAHLLATAAIVSSLIACMAAPPAPSGAPSSNPTTATGTRPSIDATPTAGLATEATDAPPAPSTPGASTTSPPLPESANLAALPAPAPLAEGVAQQQAEALVAALADAATAEGRLPFVMTALLASGIPILDEHGEAVPFEPAPAGPALQAWQVHALAATDPSRHARMAASSLVELFVEVPQEADVAALRSALSLDLRTAAFGADVAGQRWAWLVAGRDPRGATLTLAESETGDLLFDGLQLQLLLARLAVDLWRDSPESLSAPMALASLRGAPHAIPEPHDAALPCRHTRTEDAIVTTAEETGSRAMSQVIEYLGERGVGGMGALGRAGLVADIVKFLAPYLLLTIDFELSNPPLVRTKSTSQHGEQRQLAATLRFDTGNLQLVNCFRLLFASLGFTFSLPEDGPLGNGSVSWEPNKGFERVQFYGGDHRLAHSDDVGIAIVGIEGIKQKQPVAPTAGRINTEASIFLTYRVKELSLGGDLLDAATSLLDNRGNPGLLVLKLALEGISRAKWSSASFAFPVVDWGERWQAEIVIEEKSNTGSVYFSWAGILGVDSDGIVVGDGSGTVAIVGTLCVDIPPDGHSAAVDWRIDGEHSFRFDGYKENDVLHMLLPNESMSFRQTGNPGPCGFDAAFKQAAAQTTLVHMGSVPIQLRAQSGTQTIPFGEGTNLTIRMEPVSD